MVNQGFDVQAAEAQEENGFGLFSIRERLGLFGGQMRIESAPGAGIHVTVEVPLQLGEPSPWRNASLVLDAACQEPRL